MGADAQTVEQSVSTPIEQQLSGVDNMNYMYSLNANNGTMRLTTSFDVATNPNTDLVLTQIRQNLAQSQLPADVRNYGVTVQKARSAPLMIFSLFSPNESHDGIFLANYAYINIVDQLLRIPGVGDGDGVRRGPVCDAHLGSARRAGEAGDHGSARSIDAVQKQNAVNPAGQIGSEPSPAGQEFTYTVRAQGRLVSAGGVRADRFARPIPTASIVRLQDVARIELGAQDYNIKGRLNGKPGAIIAVYQLPGSNAMRRPRRPAR